VDAVDLDLLRATVASVISADRSAAANDAALDAIGWGDMFAAEPDDAVGVVFGQLGRAAARSGLLDDVVGSALGLDAGAIVAHPKWGDLSPGSTAHANSLSVTFGPRFEGVEPAHVVTDRGIASISATAVTLADRGAAGFWAEATIDFAASEATAVALPAEAIAAATSAARRALAHQLHGLAAGMLELARAHAAERIQFGHPIGAFQAVRHKLAETHVAVESAGDALAAIRPDDPMSVDLARIIAGRAALDAGRHCQQVLAGIGFTRDHDFHRYLFTAIELDGLYGTTAALTAHIGRQLIADRTLPRLVQL
jgi:hypothetical protein